MSGPTEHQALGRIQQSDLPSSTKTLTEDILPDNNRNNRKPLCGRHCGCDGSLIVFPEQYCKQTLLMWYRHPTFSREHTGLLLKRCLCTQRYVMSSLLLISSRSYFFCSFTCPYSFLLIILFPSPLSTIYVLFIQQLLVSHLLHPSAYSRTSHPNYNQLVWSLFNSDDPGSHKNGFQLAPKGMSCEKWLTVFKHTVTVWDGSSNVKWYAAIDDDSTGM